MVHWYAALIRSVCDEAAIAEWKAVAEAQQIEANGKVVSLYPETESSTNLVLYVELTTQPVAADLDMLRHMLESNAAALSTAGQFALVPGRGTAAYRTVIANADRLSGDDLLAAILSLVFNATSQFREVMIVRATRLASHPEHACTAQLLGKGRQS